MHTESACFDWLLTLTELLEFDTVVSSDKFNAKGTCSVKFFGCVHTLIISTVSLAFFLANTSGRFPGFLYASARTTSWFHRHRALTVRYGTGRSRLLQPGRFLRDCMWYSAIDRLFHFQKSKFRKFWTLVTRFFRYFLWIIFAVIVRNYFKLKHRNIRIFLPQFRSNASYIQLLQLWVDFT